MEDDWLEHLEAFSHLEAIELGGLSSGDQMLVETQNSHYWLRLVDATKRRVEMKSTNPEAPLGELILMGCALGSSSSIAPDRLFCGGCLELNYQDEEGKLLTFTTSKIQGVSLLQQESEL